LGQEIVGFLVVMALPDDYDLWLTAETTNLSYDDLEAIALALLETLTFSVDDPELSSPEWSIYFEGNCTLRFVYPTGWLVDSHFEKVLVFSSTDARTAHFGDMPFLPDELAIEIIPPHEIVDYFYPEFDPNEATATEVLEAYAQREQLFLMGTPTPVTLGDHEVLRTEIEGGMIFIFDFGDTGYAIFAAQSAFDGFIDFEDTVLTIAESLYVQSDD
jgi:hypothetical protein